MSLRTAIPALIASVALAGFAPASSADESTVPTLVPTSLPAPTAQTIAPAPPPIQLNTPEPTLGMTTAPTTPAPGQIVLPPTTTTTEPTTTAPTTTAPTTTEPATTQPPSTTAEPTTTLTPTPSPTETSATTTETTTAPTTTTETTSTTTETTTTTTPPPAGELTLTTSSITGTEAAIGTQTVRLTFDVDVVDTRLEGGWTASARVSNLVGTREGQVLPSSVTYTSSSTGCSTSTGSQLLGGEDVVVHRTDEPCSASWTVTVTVQLPNGADIADLYMATVEHSLTATPTDPAPTPAET